MIIRLTQANFSANNIGVLTHWGISWKGNGYTTSDLPRSVEKGTALTVENIAISSSFTADNVPISVYMGTADVTEDASVCTITRNSAANTVTISISAVTDKLSITIGEVVSGGGSEEGGESGGGSGSTPSEIVDLSALVLAHCNSSKMTSGSKENLAYNQSTHEMTVKNGGWYKVSYFTHPLQVGMEVEFDAHYSSSVTGNFIGLYMQNELTDGVAELQSSFWPCPSTFGLYASGGTATSSTESLFLWDDDGKTAVAGVLATALNGVTVKLKLTAEGVKVFANDVEITLPRVCNVAAGTDYYLGFHNNCSNSSTPVQTIKYIGVIR